MLTGMHFFPISYLNLPSLSLKTKQNIFNRDEECQITILESRGWIVPGNHGLKLCLLDLPPEPVSHRPGAADSTSCFRHLGSIMHKRYPRNYWKSLFSGIIKINLNPEIKFRLSHLSKCHCKGSTLSYQAALACTVLHSPAGALTSHSTAFSMSGVKKGLKDAIQKKKLIQITNIYELQHNSKYSSAAAFRRN